MDDLICTLALKKIKGLQNQHIFFLLKTFKNPCEIFSAEKSDFMRAGLKAEYIKILTNSRIIRTAFFDAIKEIEEASKNGIKIITFNSVLYPSNLRLIKTKPPILYYKGVLKENLRFASAVVGQRKPPDYALELARNITIKLCSYGYSVISGLATGIDAAAHKTALKNNGYTVAYIGAGLLSPPYPPENRDLYNEIILNGGAVVSELPLHEKISSKNLVARDRLQSGSGLGTFAVSSPIKSGTMKTCNFSIKQKRPVFVPEYNLELMNSQDNLGLKSLFGGLGVSGLKLNKDFSFDITEAAEEMMQVYNKIYAGKFDEDDLSAQPSLFDFI
ncbi:MAG: DNA-processing protein DprA [Deltaproteobacteria bacterium]|jgi:DNA processing protein|nr:DNA-processing protein DprA [Deltaproteobacteria bacterium]